ncbi:ATPase domain-containing protein [Nitrosococcus wardiae]|uniref:non-specific serine/threonine protein kinase n=1 Tax=Nitrosococcus wardiae TaxID=1814290 RepID=A0A4P7BXA5_9GAMM|nr:ATPase domain-containing protein [Nitrosococcus wardiae]QBQ54763.1 circadian clock protein KaiC [Nitrosococcus wardiae]
MTISNGEALQEIESIGVPGLDEILKGGLPKGCLYLVEGESGTGKTTLGLQFVLEGVRRGQRCLYVSLSETREELKQSAASHGWNLDGISVFVLTCGEDASVVTDQYTLFYPSEVELTSQVLQEVERVRPERLVLDTLSGLRLIANDPLRYRRQIQGIREFLSHRNCTTLIIDEIESSHPNFHFQPRSLAHGIINLERWSPAYGPDRRRLTICKLRSIDVRTGYHDCNIARGGLEVFPRLRTTTHHGEKFRGQTLSSGIAGMDTLLGGGLDCGTSCLIMGSAGTGKSCLAMSYASSAAKRGENTLYFTFDEDVDIQLARAEVIGLPLAEYAKVGKVRLETADPAVMSVGEFAVRLRDRVEANDTRLVVLDSLSGYLQAMSEQNFLNLHLYELLGYLRQKGVTTLMTLVQHGFVGAEVQTPAELSNLADTVILLRYFEAKGEVRKAISVFKKRAGNHERTIRELCIGPPDGLRLSEPLRDFQGVLTGVPHFVGNTSRDGLLFPSSC